MSVIELHSRVVGCEGGRDLSDASIAGVTGFFGIQGVFQADGCIPFFLDGVL